MRKPHSLDVRVIFGFYYVTNPTVDITLRDLRVCMHEED